jgi:hypothetical protein
VEIRDDFGDDLNWILSRLALGWKMITGLIFKERVKFARDGFSDSLKNATELNQ